MELTILLVWIVIWIILLAMSTVETRGFVYGFIAGIWILFIGAYILLDGLQIESGSTIVASGSNFIVTKTYSEIVAPISSYSILWCVPFVLISIYQMYLASTMRKHQKSIKMK